MGERPIDCRTVVVYVSSMFMLSEDDAAAILAAYKTSGEWAAVIELRRRFCGIPDNGEALRLVRVIAVKMSPPGGTDR